MANLGHYGVLQVELMGLRDGLILTRSMGVQGCLVESDNLGQDCCALMLELLVNRIDHPLC